MKWNTVRRATTLILPLLLAALPAFGELRESGEETFSLDLGGQIGLQNINGDVTIEGWEGRDVRVAWEKSSRTQEGLDRAQVKIEATSDRIRIKTDYARSDDRWGHSEGASVEYTLFVPRGAELDEVELVNGDLDLRGVEGPVSASLVNGSLDAEGLAADVELSTVNGAIFAGFATLGYGQRVSVESVNGSIKLEMPADANADVEAETVHGSIRNDFGLVEERKGHVGRRMRGQIGRGEARLDLSNVNGSITLLQR